MLTSLVLFQNHVRLRCQLGHLALIWSIFRFDFRVLRLDEPRRQVALATFSVASLVQNLVSRIHAILLGCQPDASVINMIYSFGHL